VPDPIPTTAAFVSCALAGLWGADLATLVMFTSLFLMLVAVVPLADRQPLTSDHFRKTLKGALPTLRGLLFIMCSPLE